MARVTIGTRGSALALAQTRWVARQLEAADPSLQCAIREIRTTGDARHDVSLVAIGGKGLFTKELEDALLAGDIDLAIHSMKDLPTDMPEGLAIGAVPPRETPWDAFVSRRWARFDALPEGARVGTSSLRRAAQLRAARPDLEVVDLRGNVDTRLRKVDDGVVDAAVLACAGLKRLGLDAAIRAPFDGNVLLPAVGQGALAVQCRDERAPLADRLAALNHPESAVCVTAERALLHRLEGGCQVPMGALATVRGATLLVRAVVCSLDGTRAVRVTHEGSAGRPEEAGLAAADGLLDQGAADIMAEIR